MRPTSRITPDATPRAASAEASPTRLSRRRYSGRLLGFGLPALVVGGVVASFTFARPEVVLLGAIVVGAYMLLLAMPTLLADSSVERDHDPRRRL